MIIKCVFSICKWACITRLFFLRCINYLTISSFFPFKGVCWTGSVTGLQVHCIKLGMSSLTRWTSTSLMWATPSCMRYTSFTWALPPSLPPVYTTWRGSSRVSWPTKTSHSQRVHCQCVCLCPPDSSPGQHKTDQARRSLHGSHTQTLPGLHQSLCTSDFY